MSQQQLQLITGSGLAPSWKGLGSRLAKGATLEEWQRAAGMDWKVQRSRVRYAIDREEPSKVREWEQHNVLFRSDTKAPLGIVSPKFKVVQPAAILEFFRDLVELNGYTMENAGILYGGRRFWATASAPEPESKVLSDEDRIGSRLLLCSAVDGTLETVGLFTSLSMVCGNMLALALSQQGKRMVKISHRSHWDPERMKLELGLARKSFAVFMTEMRALANVKLTAAQAALLTKALLSTSYEVPDAYLLQDVIAEEARESRNYRSIMELYGGKGRGALLDGRRSTAWGWVNAVTEHVDFHAQTLTPDARLDSAWFGSGDQLKTRAVEVARVFTLQNTLAPAMMKKGS
jgi:phage/plasmid-like protein (TIGR03299 family)